MSKKTLDGKCGYEIIKGETGYISIFRFPWFAPIWYYDPSLSFPHDKMRPGFFLDIADNTGDGFSYEILPVKLIKNIPTYRNPVTLVRNVVRLRDLESSEVPKCTRTQDGFIFTNRSGDELFGSEEAVSSTLNHDAPMSPNPNVDSNELALEGTKPPSLTADFLISEEQHGSNFSYLEEAQPTRCSMAAGGQATQSNEYKLLSEIVSVEDPILVSTPPSLDSPFESEAVLGNQIQYDIESMDTPPPHNHEAHTGSGF